MLLNEGVNLYVVDAVHSEAVVSDRAALSEMYPIARFARLYGAPAGCGVLKLCLAENQ